MAVAFGRGTFGELVAILQAGLAQHGYYTSKLDGDFGGGTERAVRAFQADKRLRQTGVVDRNTWRLLTGAEWPELFERCLQVTARFEGHGYQTVAGNFDGAGLTWGIIGFTLKHGEIQTIVNEVQLREPGLLRECFGDITDELLKHVKNPNSAELIAWADSISLGANKYSVQEPWRSGFTKLGAAKVAHEIQRQRARRKYFEPALLTSRRVQQGRELRSDLGVALCFDMHVQNGGVDETELTQYRRKLATLGKKATDSDKRLALARVVADNSRAKYRDDVFARKSTLATGAGVVHGQVFALNYWGLSIQKRRTKA